MKIAMIAHKFGRSDGQGRINYEIVKHGLADGHSVTLLATEVDSDLVESGATWVKVISPVRKPDLANVLYFRRRVDQLLKEMSPSFDVVAGNGSTVRRPHQVSLCQFVHGAWLRSPVHVSKLTRGPYSWYQLLYSKMSAGWEKTSYSQVKFVVAPSQKIRQELIQIGVPDEKIRVIYNGVDLDEFRPGQESRAELGLPSAKPLALFVGDIRTPRKNLDTTLRAVARLPELHLAVAGGIKRSPFPALAKELGIENRVTFLDFRRDIGRLMRAVDLFVFPSRYEAGTLVLLEALASGLPVVTARTAGGCEVMNEEAGRIISDPNNVDELVKAISETLATMAEHSRASVAARNMAEQYPWSGMAKQYLELFQESCSPAVSTR